MENFEKVLEQAIRLKSGYVNFLQEEEENTSWVYAPRKIVLFIRTIHQREGLLSLLKVIDLYYSCKVDMLNRRKK